MKKVGFWPKNFSRLDKQRNSSMELKITRPTLLLDENKMLANLQRMLEKAERTGTELIPHFKTHQSKEIGQLIKEKGVKKITVSSMKMAEYFAQNGWNDITVAFPFNPLEIDVANQLIEQGEHSLYWFQTRLWFPYWQVGSQARSTCW